MAAIPKSLLSLAILAMLTSHCAIIPKANAIGLVIRVEVTGNIYCTITGNPAPAAPALAGVTSVLSAAGKVLSTTVSVADGTIKHVIDDPMSVGILLSVRQWLVVVALPITTTAPAATTATCPLLGGGVRGTLQAAVNLVSVPIIDNVLYAVLGSWILIP